MCLLKVGSGREQGEGVGGGCSGHGRPRRLMLNSFGSTLRLYAMDVWALP